MGQGIHTAIPMLIAEELEVPLEQVELEHAPPDSELYRDPLLLNEHMTGGSSSIRYAWEPMRLADAGFVLHPASGRKLGYGELVETAATLPVPADLDTTVALKKPADFKLIGKPHRRLDSASKTNGTAQFGLDVRLSGMVYASVVHSPVIGGKLLKVDDMHARKVPGVRQIVKLDNAVAVIGDHSWAAKRGASALVIEWNDGDYAKVSTTLLAAELEQAAQRDGVVAVVARKEGDVEKGFKSAASKVDAVYRQPFLAHATMEPMNCTVHVTPERVELWVGTQVPARTIDTAVRITGLSRDKITLHNFLLGGGFGRRLETDCTEQAIRIGQQVGAPVKVMWAREEDIQHDMYRPCYYDHISAALDANGKPVAWTHRIAGSSIVARFFGTAVMKNGLDFDAIEVAADLPYDIPNQLIDYVRHEPRNVPTTFWRGVGPTRGAVVVESFIDELAVNAKVDPVEYRRSLLGKTPRALNVLNVAAKAAGWGTPLPQGQGRGVSVLHVKRLLLRRGTAALLMMLPGFEAYAADAGHELIARGAYLAKAADCVACHSSAGGKPFAGGLPMSTPMGKIFTTNITPDPDTGIGRYTEADFFRAVRGGVARDGRNLYPAMPYPSYAKINDEDMRALYAYFMHGVQPVRQDNRAAEIPWPMNMRWPLTLWNLVFLDKTIYQPKAAKDAVWNRGAYLVQGLGHCGACHTPRGPAFNEKALDESGPAFLSGAALEGWFASNLAGDHNTGLGRWSVRELQGFLKTGANAHATAFGSMTDVINHSTQTMTDADLNAMAVYLKSLPAARNDDGPAYAFNPKTTVTMLARPAGNRGADRRLFR